MLVELGANVNTETDRDRPRVHCTSLILSAGGGQVECVQALVELQADVLALDASGQSALKLASVAGHSHVVRWLAANIAASSKLASTILDADKDSSTECLAAPEVRADHGKEPANRQQVPQMCAVCTATVAHGGGKLLKCAGCKTVRYCSTDCQKRHWRSQHKEECTRKLG